MDKSSFLSPYLPQDLLTELFDNQSSTSTTPSITSLKNKSLKEKKWKKSSTAQEKNIKNEAIQLSANNAKVFSRSQTQCLPHQSSHKIDTMSIDHLKKYGINKEPVILTPSLFSMQTSIKEFLYNSGKRLPVIITSLNGSQFLLNRIDEFTEEDIDMFIIFMSKDLIGVMCDVYGHVFINQMIIMKTNPSQRLEILKLIKPFFIQISSDQYGTRCIQTLIMLIQTRDEEKIVKNSTKKYILELSFNNYSSQIIHQLIIGLADKKRNYLIKFISFNFYSFCKNPNGILVLLKFISELKDSIAFNLITSVIENNLIQFVCSNQLHMLVSQILDCFGYVKCTKIINAIVNNIFQLAINEYGVKIVVKVIEIIRSSNASEYNSLISLLFVNENNLINILNTNHGKVLLTNLWPNMPSDRKKVIKEIYVQQTTVYQAITSFDSENCYDI